MLKAFAQVLNINYYISNHFHDVSQLLVGMLAMLAMLAIECFDKSSKIYNRQNIFTVYKLYL